MAVIGQGERGPTPERLRAIALNRLKALGIPCWLAQGSARGRLVISPERFKQYAGVRLEPEQDFVVHQHAFLAFLAPSPLAHLGGIRFYEEESAQTLLLNLERRWVALIQGTEGALARARAFCPGAKLDVESWMIENTVEDRGGRVVFRFDGRIAILYAHSVDGNVIDYGEDNPPIAMQLPAEALTIDDTVLAPYVREARARYGIGPDREDTGRISLDLASADLALVREGSVVANPHLPVSGDLDFDLEALKTGDLKVYPKEERATAPVEKIDAGPEARRHARELQNVPAKMKWDGGESSVIVADVSAGGAFVRSSDPKLPARGTTVHLSGFGKLSVLGQVAFVRPQEEARLFATGAGVGISFMIEPLQDNLRSHQEAKAIAIFVADRELRRRALIAVDEARGLPWTADSMVELAVTMLHVDVRMLIIDDPMVRRAEAALGFRERGIMVLPLRSGEPIDASLIQRRLATRA